MSRRSSGFTLLELLLAVGLAVVVVGLAMVFVFQSRDVFTLDRARTNANQNLRSGLDILMADIRQAGERIGADLPAVEVTKGSSTTITLRRNLMDFVLPVCKKVQSGTGQVVFVADAGGSGTNPECKSKAETQAAVDAWDGYRVAQGGLISVYIYDPVGKFGEFFTSDKVDSSNMHVHPTSGTTWVHTYEPTNKPRLYVLEQRVYSLDTVTETLQVEIDGGPPQNVVADVTDFVVDAYKQPVGSPKLFNGDGTLSGTDWRELAYIRVQLTAEDNSRREPLVRVLADQAVPRNVLSATGSGP